MSHADAFRTSCLDGFGDVGRYGAYRQNDGVSTVGELFALADRKNAHGLLPLQYLAASTRVAYGYRAFPLRRQSSEE